MKNQKIDLAMEISGTFLHLDGGQGSRNIIYIRTYPFFSAVLRPIAIIDDDYYKQGHKF